MESSLYYTFSTIAQTLAAAIALLAAFALYRLQGLTQVIAETSLRIQEAFVGEDHGTFQSLRVAARFSELRVFIQHSEARADLASEPVASRRKTFESALNTGASIKVLLYWSLGLTVVVVLGSLVVLSQVHDLAKLSFAPLVLKAGIGGTGLCLAVYVALVRRTLT